MAGKPSDEPDPIDVHVGRRLRHFRKAAGVSQGTLGEALGLSFQQVQKYEKAVNRLSASMMLKAAHCLGVSVTELLEGAPEEMSPLAAPLTSTLRPSNDVVTLLSQLPPRQQKAVKNLIASMVEG